MSGSGIEWTPGAEWDVAEPEEAGFDRSRLAHAAEWQANDANGQPYAVLIARHGRIVAEWNFRIDPLEPARMASASKSLYSSVLGIAIGEGVIRSADDRVVDYYPELMNVPPGRGPKDGRHAFPENEGITFRQLIGNTSGYMKPGESPGKVFNYQSWGMGVLTHAVASAYSLYKTSEPERGGGFGTLTEWKLRRPIGGSWSVAVRQPAGPCVGQPAGVRLLHHVLHDAAGHGESRPAVAARRGVARRAGRPACVAGGGDKGSPA